MSKSRPWATGLFLAVASLLAACAERATFPQVNPASLKISLQRSACFGSCPDYLVTVSGDGTVVFTTDYRPPDAVAGLHRENSISGGVLVPGTHRAKIEPSAVEALVRQFRDARFFSLKDDYRGGATDAPTYVISIDTGHGTKTIVDYLGRQAGMPAAVTALEDAVDKVAGTQRWIGGGNDTVQLLQAEHFQFDSKIGLSLMAWAAQRGDVQTMERLRALGAPLFGKPSSGPLVAAASAGQLGALSWLLKQGGGGNPELLVGALSAAARSDQDKAFDILRDVAGQKQITPSVATELLRSAAENGNTRMVSDLLRLHPRLNGSANDRVLEEPPLWAAAQHSCPDQGAHPNCDHRKVVRMLLEAGAAVRWLHPGYRNSVFFQVSDPEIARMLLAAGADPNFKDPDGEPIIFSIDAEDVALAMVDAGLNLKSVRPADKMTLRGWATYQNWPRVLARLDKVGLVQMPER